MATKYIIYEDVAKDVAAALKMLIEKIDEEKDYWGSGDGSMLDFQLQHARELLHRFESGLCLLEKRKEVRKMGEHVITLGEVEDRYDREEWKNVSVRLQDI